ncbi:response regulator [Geomonas sp. RF6]|uniref:response regulator n=1 Tax=Geomonas sp. RF6 TaxID=2897342 RepID=UPI001E54AFC0|nr:response regulator [Geomonas sp. RF6]UFS70355.1 response regulator [Geomonas sp. RF6]
MTDEHLYNSRIINTYVKFVKRKYPHVDVKEALSSADIKPYEVSDQGHWFTQEQVNAFHKSLTKLTDNPDIARDAGRFSASGEGLGFMKNYIMGLIGPAHTFKALKKAVENFTKSSVYESKRLGRSKVEITVTPRPGTHESPFQCKNRMGFFEAILAVYNYDFPVIEHPECLFEGGATCRYIVTWKMSLHMKLRWLRNAFFVGCVALTALLAWFCPFGILLHAVPWMAALLLPLSFAADSMEKKELRAALTNLKGSTDELLAHTGRNYNNALMVNEVGQAISKQAGIEEVLDNIVGTLENRLGFDRCVILLADAEKTQLTFCTGFGHTEQELAFLKGTSFSLNNPESRGIFVTCYHEQETYLVNDFSEVAHTLTAHSVAWAKKMGVQAFICCPIVCENESLGVLAVDNQHTKTDLTQSDKSLLVGIAQVIGISIRNAMYISQERRLSEQIRQSQKMEAIGQLAGGVAHDFNNMLTAMIGFATLAQMQTDETHPSVPYLKQILLAAERATHLTKGLLSFSRKQISHPQPVEVGQLVRSMEKLLRRLISEEIELRLSLTDERLMVVADSGQIDQVILNLATNARDAMTGGGVLLIATSHTYIDAEFVEARGFGAVGSYALLTVSDTGTGMDAETKAHVFEPFFTTKEVGKGTGLGLAIVYGNVKQHNGYIDIESAPGKGTTFNIYLPLEQREAAPLRVLEGKKLELKGTETVLVVEDSPEVRTLTKEVLEKSGYRVIEAADGADAVAKFKQHADEVKLIIMDVVMPKMNGKEAFEALSKVRPDLKVLFTSGYTPDDVNRKGIKFGTDNFLCKPSTPQVLLEKVREVLVA